VVGFMKIENVLIVDPLIGEFTGDIITEGKTICDIIPHYCNYEKIVMPGFADVHTHAFEKIDTMNASKEDFEKWSKKNFEHGVTSLIPTTVSASKEDILKVIENIKFCVTPIEGLHLEGPFINPEKKGAQNPDYIRNPSVDEIVEITPDFVRLITMAPERPNFYEALKYLQKKNIKVSIGHSGAGYDMMEKAYLNGADRITHFPNALNQLHHRDISGTGSAMLLDFNVELICDGIHSSKEFIKLTYKVKGSDRIILITDSMEAAGLNDGKYNLGGLDVYVEKGVARLKSGNIAGSTLLFDKGVKNFYEFTGCSLKELSKVSSYNALKDLNIENKGRIKIGYNANFVVLDKEINVQETIFEGKTVYKK